MPEELTERCAGCDRRLVRTYDAIGRARIRCPFCDGVSAIRPHPDAVLVPQGLVRAPAREELPAIGPGQIRCQLCARGVKLTERFCADCAPRSAAGRHYEPKLCAEPPCGRIFVPRGPRQIYCERCQ